MKTSNDSLLIMSTATGKRQFNKIKELPNEIERLKYLSHGPLTVTEWMNITTRSKFYRPALRGIAVAIGDKNDLSQEFQQFKGEKKALAYGKIVLQWIANRIDRLQAEKGEGK